MLLRVTVLFAGLAAATAATACSAANAAADEARRAIVAANNAFTFDLYEALRHEAANLFVSPLSASAVLALVYLGAGGNTATQMCNALHFPQDKQRVGEGYRALIDSFQRSNLTTLRMGNKVYVDQSVKLKESFQKMAMASFRAAAEALDFAHETEKARLAINSWVEGATDGTIKNFIEGGSLDSNTEMVLVNTVLFKGSWLQPFSEPLTQPQAFHVSTKEKKVVPMMHRSGQYLYCATLPGIAARAVELPYLGELGYVVKMVIVLPNEIDGLPEVESRMRNLKLGDLGECMTLEDVKVSLPKFTVESTFDLHKTLPQLGIQDLFDGGVANLTGITEQASYVSEVIQKTFIEVNENGTIASAATGVFGDRIGAAETLDFIVDRPFEFLLINADDTILFIGRITRP